MAECPLCFESASVGSRDYGRIYVVECPNCGPYRISERALRSLPGTPERTKLSYAIFRMGERSNDVVFDHDLVAGILRTMDLPSPTEQIDGLVEYIGDILRKEVRPGGAIDVHPRRSLMAMLGVAEPSDVIYVLIQMRDASLVHGVSSAIEVGVALDGLKVGLTLDGWNHYQDLKRGAANSRTAFMAMKYGDSVSDEMYEECFKPACLEAGFELRRLDETPKAGLIDDNLRVEIRNSRFLLSDLSHGNQGAYWEAGFAEGLGKPVIYLCEKSVFEDEQTKPHFDTNHCQTVVWEQDRKGQAKNDLKATIRATLPAEAKMVDDTT